MVARTKNWPTASEKVLGWTERYPDSLEEARQTCTPKGRCKIGWIVADGGRESWDVWLDIHTGAGRLRRRKE